MSENTEQKPPSPEVPKELEDQLGAVKALAQCYNLLQKGLYPHGYAPAIDQSLQFLQALHTQSLKNAMEHPQAHLVPELQQIKEEGQNV